MVYIPDDEMERILRNMILERAVKDAEPTLVAQFKRIFTAEFIEKAVKEQLVAVRNSAISNASYEITREFEKEIKERLMKEIHNPETMEKLDKFIKEHIDKKFAENMKINITYHVDVFIEQK